MKLAYTFILSTILLIGCTSDDTTISMSTDNPFNVSLNEPIDYVNVTGNHIEEYIDTSISNAKGKIESIKKQKEVTFDNSFIVLDDILNDMSKAYSNAHTLYWVSPDSIIRAKGLEGYQKMIPLFTDFFSDKELFNQFKKFAESDAYNNLTGHRKLLVDDTLKGFEESGVNLNDVDLVKYKTLVEEISGLTSRYSDNMNSDTPILILDEESAKGLSENFKNTYKKEDGSYEIPVMNATRRPVMNNANSETIRKDYYFKFYNRGADENLTILDSLVHKRDELAKIMGYNTYAEYNLTNKMAKNPENVWAFINDLIEKSNDKANEDHELLKAFRNNYVGITSDESIKPWNHGFYHNQLLKQDYEVDSEKIREYLQMDECLTAMLDLYQELLGYQFKKIENPSVWHEEVEMYEVYEGDILRGSFYLDLFPRPGKEAWFYGVGLNEGKATKDGYEVPVKMLLGNFTRPTEDLPSLLSKGELNTLFHEFGHIMDGISYEGEFSSQANGKSDFAEAMSQIFENWTNDYEILSTLTKHYETGEVLPKEMFDKMKRASTFGSGLSTQGSLSYCLYDLFLYDKYDSEALTDTDDLWIMVDESLPIMPRYVEGTHRQTSWIHINTHPVYMYGYLWSEVYAQDMFTEFEKNGLRDSETGIRYRKLILANGSQRDIVEAVEEFLGRPSNNKAYIKSLGLK